MKEEDYYSNTVEGAAGYADYHSVPEDNGYAGDYYEDSDQEDEDEYDSLDRCNCSCPWCPCEGHKVGGM